MNPHTALIIGAGPAGLTAAYELSKQGYPSVILEADQQVGGISRTVNHRGYRFDIGGHRFFSKVPYVNQVWNEILGPDFLTRPRLSRIYYNDTFFDYPLKAFNALSQLGPVESMRVGMSYGKARLFPTEPETNLEEWVSNRFGYRLYDIFFKTYTEKVWGIPCSEISSDWAAQRIKNLSLTEAIRNALVGGRGGKNGEVITTLIEQFQYPRLGPGMMWERCETLLADRGNPTRFAERVVQINHTNNRVTHVTARTHAGETTPYEAAHYISSMPLRELIFALSPAPPDEVLSAAQNLRYRDYLTVVLVINQEEVFPDNWIYIHDPSVKMGRIQNYKNWSPEMIPDPSKTSLGLEYFLWEADDEWTWEDSRLIELGIRECAQIGLIHPRDVQEGTVVRMKKAYPVYDQHYQESLTIIQAYLARFENLQTIGRNGLHRYNNQDHSMLTGIFAARNLLGETHDVWKVNTEQAYHEQQDAEASVSGDRLIPTRIVVEEEEKVTAPTAPLEALFAMLDPVALGLALGITLGLGVFMVTAVLLLKGGDLIGPNLALLSQVFPGYSVTWPGAVLGMAEGVLAGFVLGFLGAWLRNWGLRTYLTALHRRAEAEENPDLLDKV